jgi:hypothetical protein
MRRRPVDGRGLQRLRGTTWVQPMASRPARRSTCRSTDVRRSSAIRPVLKRRSRSSLVLLLFEFPRREAADVNVELVDSGLVTVAREMQLELHLGNGDG